MNGWPIVGWAALAIAAMVAVILGTVGAGVPGIQMALRATARTSAVFFALAFAASALRRQWRTAATAWLLRNRRQLGVSFAVSHFIHLLLVFALMGWSWAVLRARLPTEALVIGGLAYTFIALMTLTSFDVAIAWLGTRAWRWLHTLGSYYLWTIFALNYFTRAARSAFYWPFAVLFGGVMLLRWLPKLRAAATSEGARP